jgi:CheY-like chemotaxis protein
MNILIAEDDSLSSALLRRIVEFDGRHTVTVARDGCEAWTALNDPAKAFDVCIVDVFMPQKDGLKLVEEMRGDGRLKAVPVILCTAADDLQTVKKAASLGVSHYIVKPFSRAVILGKLSHIGGAVPDDGTLENPEAVCTRLGIDGDARRTMLASLVDEVEGWCRRLREAKERVQVADLAILGTGLRGACLNLGAKSAAAQIHRVHAALKEFLGRPAEAGAAPPPETLEAALGPLEADLQRIGGRVKAAA